MHKEKRLVEMATEICETCVSLRQQEVRLVRIDSWLSCPFKRTVASIAPPPICLARPGNCVRNDGYDKCPLSKTPLYLDGEIIMLEGISYKVKRI